MDLFSFRAVVITSIIFMFPLNNKGSINSLSRTMKIIIFLLVALNTIILVFIPQLKPQTYSADFQMPDNFLILVASSSFSDSEKNKDRTMETFYVMGYWIFFLLFSK